MEKSSLVSKKISIIGAGRVGQSLGKALSKKGYIIGGLSCRNLTEAKQAAKFLGQGYPYQKNAEAVGNSGIIFITTPDDVIKNVVKELSKEELSWRGRVVFHCSGVLSSTLLSPLKKAGAATASLHPLQSFPEPYQVEKAFQGIFFLLEGDEEAFPIAQSLVKALGGHLLYLKSEDKALYHAAAAIASNYLISLLFIACKLMGKAGIPLRQAEDALLPLMRRTLANAEHFGIVHSLTGPISRGDEQTISLHLKALKAVDAELERIYRLIGLETLKIAENQGLISPTKKLKLLKLLQPSD